MLNSEDTQTMCNRSDIVSGSLAENLYTHYALIDLENLLQLNSLEQVMQQWKHSDEQCREQIVLAIQYIKAD